MENSLPDKCRTCPQVLERLEHIREHQQEAKEIIDHAMSDEVDQIAAYIKQSSSEVGVDFGDTSPEEIAAIFRKQASLHIEQGDATIESHELELSQFAANCLSGPLKLRGTRDGRRMYTATICTSPAATDEPYEPVTISRTVI